MKTKKGLALLLAAAMAASSLAGCSSGKTTETGTGDNGSSGNTGGGKTSIMTIGTGDSTGTLYPVGAAVASVLNDNVAGFKVNVETAKGSPANCMNVQGGTIDMGLSTGDVALQAIEGTGAFEGSPCEDVRALCAVFASMSGWMALKSSGLTMVNQLDGKNVAIGPEASATEIAALVAFEQLGITPGTTVNLGLGDAAEEVGDGLRDATTAFGGLPIGGHLSVAQTKECTFLGYTDEELDKIVASNPSYYKTKIPAGTYPGQDEDIPTFGVKCLIVVNASMDDETAYKFAEAIATHVDELASAHAAMTDMKDPDFLCNNIPIELHPGAAAYYKEAGMLK